MHEFDAYTPAEIAARVSAGGVTKARLPLSTLFLLGIMAGGFVGIGALYFTIIVSDSELSFAIARLIGGICFSIGLLLVVVCGAELFTGNILIAMAWADGSIRFTELLRNWAVVCLANFIGAAGFALLVFLSGHWELNGGAVGATYLKIAAAKAGLPFWQAFFEHSIANMYFFPMALLLQASGSYSQNGLHDITTSDIAGNLIPVISGNIVGGSSLVALIYWLIYRKNIKRT